MADAFQSQEFEWAVRFKVRHIFDLDCDEVTGFIHSCPLPWDWATTSERQLIHAPPVKIAYVPEPALKFKYHPNSCHRVMGTTRSGKTNVGGVYRVTITKNSPTPTVFQPRKWLDPVDRNGLGAVCGRGQSRN